MKRVWGSLTVLAGLLAGCAGPVSTLYREGSTFDQRRAVADQCRIAALERIPPAMVTTVDPGFRGPPMLHCRDENGRRVCRDAGMRFGIPPSVSTRDVNAALRDRDVVNCLKAAGYEVLERPICHSGPQMADYLKQRDGQSDPSALACVADDDAVTPPGER